MPRTLIYISKDGNSVWLNRGTTSYLELPRLNWHIQRLLALLGDPIYRMSNTGENILTGMSSLGISFDQPEFIQLIRLLIMEFGGPAVNMRGEVIGIAI